MRTILSVALLALLAAPAYAQQPVTADLEVKSGFRFYVAPVAQISRINESTADIRGLEFGWLATPRLTLGFATYRLANAIKADQPNVNGDGTENVDFFYSGITGEYALCNCPNYKLTARALLGVAEAHWRDGYRIGMPEKDHRDAEHTSSFVAEPTLGLEYKVLPWLRADVAAGYRFVGWGESQVIEQKDMAAFTGTLGLRIGRF